MKTTRSVLVVAAVFSFHLCARAQERIELPASNQQPVVYGLVVDNSGSLRTRMTEVVNAGKQIVDSNRPPATKHFS